MEPARSVGGLCGGVRLEGGAQGGATAFGDWGLSRSRLLRFVSNSQVADYLMDWGIRCEMILGSMSKVGTRCPPPVYSFGFTDYHCLP